MNDFVGRKKNSRYEIDINLLVDNDEIKKIEITKGGNLTVFGRNGIVVDFGSITECKAFFKEVRDLYKLHDLEDGTAINYESNN